MINLLQKSFYKFCSLLAWMFILVEVFKLWYMASVVIVSAGLMFYNFFLHKHWSFRGLNKHKKDHKSR